MMKIIILLSLINSIAMGKTEKVSDKSELKTKIVQKPKLNKSQFAYFDEDRYIIFSIKVFNKLKLSESCYKKNKPNCDAFDLSKMKGEMPAFENNNRIHPASMYCKEIGGRSIVAITHDGNDYDFCLAKDKSLVSSWSLYYNRFPQQN